MSMDKCYVLAVLWCPFAESQTEATAQARDVRFKMQLFRFTRRQRLYLVRSLLLRRRRNVAISFADIQRA